MDMEKLTKQQIVLVTLLVSFVTSIATGIVTVALMDQAPPDVVQTINRVVERTIEKVVSPPTTNNAAAVITREMVVVKEDDKIVESIDKNKASVVRIYTNTPFAGDVNQRMFIGLGTIVSQDGLIVTGDVFADPNGQYLVTLDNNKFYNVVVLPKKEGDKLYFLKISHEKNSPVSFTPVVLTNSDALKLGQTIISWGGQIQNSVSTGIVSSLVDVEGKFSQASTTASTTATTTLALVSKEIIAINTNVNLVDSLSGGPLLNLYGEVVGIRVGTTVSDKYNYLPSNLIKKEIADYASVQ